MRFELTINGRAHVVEVPAETSLLEVLRIDLGLLAAKYGCGEEQCGACCVLVDGRSTPSCTLRVEDAVGHAIVTTEGLAEGGELTAVQRAFVDEHALQCGYCTSGMVIAASALLADRPDPSDAEIRAALDGHLCRCGVYERARRAVHAAARSSR